MATPSARSALAPHALGSARPTSASTGIMTRPIEDQLSSVFDLIYEDDDNDQTQEPFLDAFALLDMLMSVNSEMDLSTHQQASQHGDDDSTTTTSAPSARRSFASGQQRGSASSGAATAARSYGVNDVDDDEEGDLLTADDEAVDGEANRSLLATGTTAIHSVHGNDGVRAWQAILDDVDELAHSADEVLDPAEAARQRRLSRLDFISLLMRLPRELLRLVMQSLLRLAMNDTNVGTGPDSTSSSVSRASSSSSPTAKTPKSKKAGSSVSGAAAGTSAAKKKSASKGAGLDLCVSGFAVRK